MLDSTVSMAMLDALACVVPPIPSAAMHEPPEV